MPPSNCDYRDGQLNTNCLKCTYACDICMCLYEICFDISDILDIFVMQESCACMRNFYRNFDFTAKTGKTINKFSSLSHPLCKNVLSSIESGEEYDCEYFSIKEERLICLRQIFT